MDGLGIDRDVCETCLLLRGRYPERLWPKTELLTFFLSVPFGPLDKLGRCVLLLIEFNYIL